jgi:tagatose-1,6-bisphosphate aldolase non-catalytic subunit AgaZ/GatZ
MAQREFLGKLKVLEDKIDKIPKGILTKIVDQIIQDSPDDTGAYILSHSIGRSGNVGYSLSSRNRVQAPETHREDARSKLMAQVATFPADSARIWVGNNAPHVNAVETGEAGNWRRSGYYVYTNLRSSVSFMVAEAIREAGLK